MELWRRSVGVATWRHEGTSKRAARAARTEVVGVESGDINSNKGIDLWRPLQTCRRKGVEVWSSGA